MPSFDPSPPATAAYSRTFLLFLGAATALAAVALYLVFQGKLNADEGFYLLASRMVRGGFRPYRDFGFTQGPVLPYVNVPWLELFGYSLDGQRLTSLAWLAIAVAMSVAWLKRYHSWSLVAVFLWVLIGAPSWMEYMVKGKTYAFGSLCVVVGTWALLDGGRWWVRWLLFIAAAGLGVGARFPLAGFFLPAGLCLLIATPTWKERMLAVGATSVVAALLLWWAAAGSWGNFVFWTMQFHQETLFKFPLSRRLWDAVRYAPGVWVLAAIAGVIFVRRRQWKPAMALGCLGIALVLNISAPSTYAEYLMPFVLASAMIGAPVLGDLVAKNSRGVGLFTLLALALAGWISPLERTKDILLQAGEAEAYLRSSATPGSQVIASMPEIPVAAGLKVPLPMVMGKFALTQDYPSAFAASHLMVTPEMVVALIRDPSTSAVVFSAFANWNFAWSVPSYRPISKDSQNSIRAAINRDFQLGFVNDEYLVFVRKMPVPPNK
jgi:hypothetical protein